MGITIEGIDSKNWALCPNCRYLWRKKTHSPKECPRCKVRLDRETK